MAATNIESLTNPRDSLPNVYTNVKAREIDFVTRFNQNWDALRDILGIMRPIRKSNGTQLVSYTATVDLEDGAVDAGCVIPYSKSTIVESAHADLTIEKYAKAVPIEDVAKYGAAIAVQKSDDAFLNKLQSKVLTNFYSFLTGTSGVQTDTAATWQAALSKAQGLVVEKFAELDKSVTDIVGFASIEDAYDYLGTAEITVQTQFGLTYLENFLGYKTLFLLPATRLDKGTVIALPVENIDLYYADPSDSEFAQLGLVYTTEGETNLIGFHAQGNYGTAVGESFALMGMALWADIIDGIAKVTVSSNPLKPLTVNAESEEATIFGTDVSDMQSDLSVKSGKITGTLKYLDEGALPTTWGAGYFMALKFEDIDQNATSVKVGLTPSVSSGLVEIIDDPDKNGAFKVTDKLNQKFTVVVSDGTNSITKYYDLSDIVMD